jgi:hypothetical protein
LQRRLKLLTPIIFGVVISSLFICFLNRQIQWYCKIGINTFAKHLCSWNTPSMFVSLWLLLARLVFGKRGTDKGIITPFWKDKLTCRYCSSTLKMETVCFSETFVSPNKSTWRYIIPTSTSSPPWEPQISKTYSIHPFLPVGAEVQKRDTHLCGSPFWFCLKCFIISELILRQNRPEDRWRNGCIPQMRDQPVAMLISPQGSTQTQADSRQLLWGEDSFWHTPCICGQQGHAAIAPHGLFRGQANTEHWSCEKLDGSIIYIPAYGGACSS